MLTIGSFLATIYYILSVNLIITNNEKIRIKKIANPLFNFLIAFLSLALLGFQSIILPRPVSVILEIFCILFLSITNLIQSRMNISILIKGLFPFNLRPAIASWLILGILATLASLLVFEKPSDLPDGPYVYKSWTKNVQMQWAAGDMPADNALPYFAGEFLTRKIDLSKIHPFAPGQEIVDRTFLVPFSYLAVRNLYPDSKFDSRISEFSYVNRNWPNAMDFYDSSTYELYNGISFALEGYLAFVIAFLGIRGIKSNKFRYFPALLIGVFPFLFHQTYFSWTKSLCTAFALIGIKFFVDKRFVASGFALAMAFQVHPMALIYFLSLLILAFFQNRKSLLHLILPFLTGFVIWNLWIYTTGLKNDLVQQNLFFKQHLIQHLFARITSLYNYVNPSFLNTYPFQIKPFVNNWFIAGFPLALLVLLISFYNVRHFNISYEDVTMLVVSVISLLLSISVMSRPSPVQFFGGQLLISSCLILGVNRINSLRIYLGIFIIIFAGYVSWIFSTVFI